jgi:hypothetical protein
LSFHPAAANLALSAASHSLRKLESDPRDARLPRTERVGGDVRDIYDSASSVRSSIDNRTDCGAAAIEPFSGSGSCVVAARIETP